MSTLLYCLGEGAEDILTSTGITSQERAKYDTKYDKELEKFDNFFQVRKNAMFERARFNQWNQGEGETADVFIAALHNLAENCNYGALKLELICDRFVVGIRDSSLSQRLQLDPELTLEKAQTIIHQKEAVKDQQETLKSSNLESGGLCLDQPQPGELAASTTGSTGRAPKDQSKWKDVQTVGITIIGEKGVRQREWFVTDVRREDIFLLSAAQRDWTK